MYKDLVWVKINSSSYYNVLIRLNDIGITIYDNKKYKDYILIKTNIEDYKKLKKYLVSYKISIYSITGINKIKELFNKYIIFTISIILSIILLIFANNIIFKVDVKSNNKKIRELVIKELNNNNLGVMKLKKNHKEVEIIVKNILDNNKDTLEWLEIKYDGLIMVVNVTEKTINKENKINNYCNIVANTDAKIISMNIYRGVQLKEINDYVYKDDVIISGSITHNDEIKKYTGKKRYNFNIKLDNKRYNIFKSRIENLKDIEETNLYTLNNFEINLVKEKEYVLDNVKLTEDETYNKGIFEGIEKIKLTLDNDEEILLQKVLKKTINDSTIEIDIFVVTKENIGRVVILEEESIDGGLSSTENSE